MLGKVRNKVEAFGDFFNCTAISSLSLLNRVFRVLGTRMLHMLVCSAYLRAGVACLRAYVLMCLRD